MTVRANVTVSFDAEDELDAEHTVEDWKMHEGSQVTLTVNAIRQGVADATGKVELELPAAAPPPMMAPPMPLPN